MRNAFFTTSMLALAGLLSACGDDTPVATPPAPVHVRIVDTAGAAVPSVAVHVRAQPGAEDSPGTWDAERATLTLPPSARGWNLLLTAPGHVALPVEDVRADRDVVLPAGWHVKMHVLADVPLPESPVHVVLRLRPAPSFEHPVLESGGLSRGQLINLVTCATEPDLALKTPPREVFGLALSRAQAEAGVFLPLAGRYSVHWGLFDEKAGTWFGLSGGIEVGVTERAAPQDFNLRITPKDLAATQKGLQEGIERQRGG